MLWSAVLLVCCVLGYAQENGDSPGSTEYTSYQGLRGRLALRPGPVTWSDANAFCQIEEASLAAPWSEAFTRTVGTLLTIGGFRAAHSGKRSTLPFLPGSGSRAEVVVCGLFLANSSTAEGACEEPLPYVCFKADVEPEMPQRTGYEYIDAVQAWMKLHLVPRSWFAARLACHLEGAFLVASWSPLLVREIKAMARRTESSIHLGAIQRKVYTDANFQQVNGFPMLSLSPESVTLSNKCIVMRPNGKEDINDCTDELPFICFMPQYTGSANPDNPYSNIPQIISRPFAINTNSFPLSASHTSPTTVNPSSQIGNTSLDPTPSANQNKTVLNPVKTDTNSLTPTDPTSIVTIATTNTQSSITKRGSTIASTIVSGTPTASGILADSSSISTDTFTVCDEMGLEGYKWYEVTDQCYKFHPYGATWVAANATCQEEGTSLAVANSDEEAQLFKQLLLENLKTGIRDAKFKQAVALGFYYDQERKIWITIDGTPLEQSGFAKWWPGWPSASQYAPRGFMESTGRLENYGEQITTPFICEAAR